MFRIKFLFLFSYIFFLNAPLSNRALAQNTYFLNGAVKDQLQMPVPGASVTILSKNDQQVILKTVTNSEGLFSFKTKASAIEISVSYVGYQLYRSGEVRISKDLVLQTIVLVSDNKLKEVEIKGQNNPPLIQAEGGKIVFNVSNSINAQGTNVLEVLKKTPGVSVSNDNTISIAGRQGSLVMLNGKQTFMQTAEIAELLRSTPSSNVKSIEVINNPSAQYDAAGSGGIINIVLKKNENEGLNGTINTGVSYGLTVKNNTDFSFNYRKDRLNIFGNYNHTIGNYGLRYGTDRDENGTSYRGWSKDTDKRKVIGSGIGLDYKIDSSQSIGVLFNGNFLFGGGDIFTNTIVRDISTGEIKNTLFSESNYYLQSSKRYNSNLNYHFEDTSGTALNVDLDYGNFNSRTGNLQPNTSFLPDGTKILSTETRILSNRDIDLYALSANYAHKLWNGKVSTGLKYSSVSAENLFNLYNVNGISEILDTKVSNRFNFKEQIFSSFLQYEHGLTKKLSLLAGIRLEQTNATGTLTAAEQSNSKIKRNYLNGFPSLSLMMKIKEGQSLSLSYGRRIDRPAYQDLNPIEQPLDGISYLKGNPYLLPQTTQRISVQYSIKKTIIDLSFSRISNYFAQITDTIGQNKLVTQPLNLGMQQQAALSIIQQFSPLPIWNISLNALVYYQQNNVSFARNRHFKLDRLAGSFNIQQSIKLPLDIKGEVSAIFNTNRLGGSNDISRRNSQIDVGFQRSILGKKARLGLVFTDIYLGNWWDSTSYYKGYFIRSYGYGESRQIKLNFSYNFGNAKVKAPKEKESGLKSETNRL